MAYRSVVVGTDGSATAELAVREAARMAKAFGARLTIVTAFAPHPEGDVARAQADVPEELKWVVTDAAQADDKACSGKDVAREEGVDEVHTRVERGDPADALIRVADDVGADLIVVGSRGMTSASRFLLGSVPNKVSHHAPCDLIIVRTAR